ncbi:MAG: filamentous hemagglutinin family protein [Methylacidiphilales bacterium]|nr:filamentous hemagglutinin family protein [Candidatus Methylacidiphilales bacterium]
MRNSRAIARARLGALIFSLSLATLFLEPHALARNGLRGNATGPAGISPAATQTTTAATAATAQTAQAALTAKIAQNYFAKAVASIQARQSAQAAAMAAANPSGVPNGLGTGGLNPDSPLSSLTTGPAIQLIELNGGNKNQLALGGSGTVTLPNGTPASDQVNITGAGSITSGGGKVVASAGSLTTTTGGTLAATNGGTVSLTAGSGTMAVTTSTTLTSTLAGTVTLAGGGTVALTANQPVTVPAGSSISFSGTGTGTVSVSGPGTVTLSGAGTLALANAAAAAAGGSITTNGGTTNFTSGTSVTSLTAGSQISLTGSGTISLTGATSSAAPTTLSLILPSASPFTTTGTELSTTGYNLPGSWTGVGALSQSTSTGNAQTTVTITQNAQEALLNWTTFNIGGNTLLDFDQSAGGAGVGSWVAINKIEESSLAPSQILGHMEASGQVYVINQNGIIFGGSSQVNTHALVASSLPINTNLTSPEELLGGASTDDQFLFSQLPVAQVQGVTGALPTFTPPAAPTGGDGDVVVQKGAQLISPTTPENVGGKIALIAPVVDNEGIISTPDGQTILAAGLQVGFTAHAGSDASLRGLDVFIGGGIGPGFTGEDAGGVPYGTVTNNGIIDSPRADITMAGMNVNQDGIIESLTSVTLNGRVDLLADYGATAEVFSQLIGGNNITVGVFAPSETGTVTLGADSVTEILPDSTGATIVGTSLALPSLVNIEGLNINMESGADLLAPGAVATAGTSSSGETVDLTGAALTSGINLTAGTWNSGAGGLALSPTSGQVNIDSGAVIDASGSQDVSASVAENIIAVQLRGTELADSPLQQNGPLRGQTVYVNIAESGVDNGQAWIGSPIGDLSGYAALVPHTANELTVNGGTVGIEAGGGVNIAQGSTINVSGGWINYQGAYVQTTKVVKANGQIIDISQATPDQVYQGIYTGDTVTSSKWNTSQTFSSPLVNGTTYDSGYIQGGNGGALTISTPSLTLQGSLYGNTMAGINQVTPRVANSLPQFANATFTGSNFMPILLPIDAVPNPSTLVLNLFPQSTGGGQAPTIPPVDVVFQSSSAPVAADPFASSGNALLNLSSDLVNLDGFGNLTIDSNLPLSNDYNATTPGLAVAMEGNITLPAGVSLNSGSGGSITLAANNIDLEGSIAVPDGSLSFTAENLAGDNTANATAPLEAVAGSGTFTLGANAFLSTAGLIVDNAAGSPDANALPQIVNGGSITIKSFNADLQTGSSIDASGGVVVNAAGKATYGTGGSIDIEAGQNPFASGGNFAILGGQLYLGSSLSAFSGSTGGSLSIVAPAIQVGGTALANGDTSGAPAQESASVWGNGTTLWLDKAGTPDFFSQGGFSSFSLTGIGLAPITYANGVATSVNPYSSTPGMFIASGTNLDPLVQNYVETLDSNGMDLVPTTNSLASQRTPVSLTFDASGVTASGLPTPILVVRGDLVMQAGATIHTDPKGHVGLKGQTVAALGQIYAPGGSITVSGASNSVNLFQANLSGQTSASDIVATVDLGPGSLLSTAGVTETTFNVFGDNTGNVLNGGTITISGNIVGEANSVLNVSGTSAVLDVAPGSAGVVNSNSGLGPQAMVATQEESNGGTITFTGGQELFVDSILIGAAGGSQAQPGSLSIANGFSGYNAVNPSLTAFQTTLDATLDVIAGGPTRANSALTGQAVIGQEVTPTTSLNDVDGNAILGYFSPNSNLFVTTMPVPATTNNGGVAGGFGSLTLNGIVQFSGQVSITTSTSLVVGTDPTLINNRIQEVDGVLNSLYVNSPVTLASSYVALGMPFAGPNQNTSPFQPTSGPNTLTVNASNLIDVGNLLMGNIDQLNLNSLGDVRGDGALSVTGNISISAAQIYPITDSTFTIAAFAPSGGSSLISLAYAGGTLPSLPLSAGGTLDIYADTIMQGGVLRAPMGTINLGTLAPPAGSNLPVTGQVTLASGSITSVSAVDPVTGLGITIPYGSIDNSGNWIDPAGNTITAGSNPTLPAKTITISAGVVKDNSGSTLDIQGGGNLEAAQFVAGTGGTADILNSTTSFAILPASESKSSYAPSDPVPGYATTAYGNLKVGDQIFLSASNGLPAGYYTLLPARYALLPGAFLVTPMSGTPNGASTTLADGSNVVSGYRASSLNSAREQPLDTLFEVDSQAVVESRAQYATSLANTYFPQSAASLGVATPRLPIDAGQLVLDATESLTLPDTLGTLLGQAGMGGLGGIVSISSSTPINIYNSGNPSTPAISGDLNLDASALDSFGADTLLIGGFSTATPTGTEVSVSTSSLTVNDAGTSLIGPDIILVSTGTLTVDNGASIESTPGSTVVAPLFQISGDGAALRVSSDSSAEIARSNVTANTAGPDLSVGSGAFIGSTTGSGSVILDSTSAASLDPLALLSATSVALDSGQISLVLPNLASPITTPPAGLVLSSATLSTLQSTAQNFSLLSYSSLDIWGSGNIGASPDSSGAYAVQNLTLHAAEIRGFDNGGGTVDINAKNVVLDNSSNGTGPGPALGSTPTGTFAINSNTLSLGVNSLAIDQYAQVALTASSAIVLSNGSGSLVTAGDLTISTPLLTAAPITPLTPQQELNGQTPATATTQTISAGGALTITDPGTVPTLAEGLGANVTLAGTSVTVDSAIQLPSGTLSLVATSGDLTVGGNLSVAGKPQTIYNLTQYTSGGQISLTSYTGNVTLSPGSTLNVSAQSGGGNAGTLAISAPEGTFAFTGSTLLGEGGVGGQGGTFTLNAGNLGGSDFSLLETALNPVVAGSITGDNYLGGFTGAQTIRLQTGDVTVDGTTATDAFNLSTDTGSITVSGKIVANSGLTDANGNSTATIDVSTQTNSGGQAVVSNPGVNGGTIGLEANGSVTLLSGSLLSVAAQTINDAGKGGAVTLEAGDETNGNEPSTSSPRDGTTNRFGSGVAVVDIENGSVIDLSVAATSKMFDGSEITGTTGTLDLRAPQTQSNTDVQVDPIDGQVLNASSIVVEGYELFNLTNTGGAITSTVEGNVLANGNLFAGAASTTPTAGYTTMLNAIFGGNTALEPIATIEPGAEIINPTGDLTLAKSWDLSTYRFGPNSAAGDLTLRASGDLIFDFGASLSDGFTTNPIFPTTGLWGAVLMPAGSQSWSYRLVAGSDFGAADYQQVLPLSPANALVAASPNALAANTGTIEIGLNAPALPQDASATGASLLSAQTILQKDGYYQTIRTGTGNINIAAGGDIQFLNNVATIYTAGTQSPALSGFTVPNLINPRESNWNTFPNDDYNYSITGGTVAQGQYSQDGGNLTIFAQGNIAHYAPYDSSSGLPIAAYDSNGNPLQADSSLELPTNWLYRRGYSIGNVFGTDSNNQVASTSWWVDFSNFFEGVGALGGGNVALTAGGSISNIDAVVPTNARMPGTVANAANLVESGGGDLLVSAGGNIDGGVYYVERGQANIEAGDQITTNATRNVNLNGAAIPGTELPTTFYLGKGAIDVSSGGNLLLGPVVNPFLLPQGINNTVNDKSYFSTYASTDVVSVASLTGTITIEDAAVTGTGSDGPTSSDSLLLNFYTDQVSTNDNGVDFASYSPWLGLIESDPTAFDYQFSLMPPTFKATAFSGDINLAGNLTTSPSPTGTINLVAAGSVNAFQPIIGLSGIGALGAPVWGTSQVNLSDANPNSIPGIASPLSYIANVAQKITLAATNSGLFTTFDGLFSVSGSTDGIYALQTTQQALHADLPTDPSNSNSPLGPLHSSDSTPVYIYAGTGNVDGLELFSGKSVDLVAGSDITDTSLYVQNVNPSDITLVEAGGNISLYDVNSNLRQETHATGGLYLGEVDNASIPANDTPNGTGAGGPNAGDIQIAGPGTLEVLAGGNLNLGDGPNNGDGTGLGIVSIGNTVDPYLSTFNGADIVAAAGLGGSSQATPNAGTASFGLDPGHNSQLDFTNTAGTGFIDLFLNPGSGGTEAARYLPDLGTLLGLTNATSTQIWDIFNGTPDTSLTTQEQALQAQLTPESRDALALTIFYDVLRDAGLDHNNPNSPNANTYTEGYAAIAALFPSSNAYQGDITLTAREIKTTNGGNISLLAPGGQIDVGINNPGTQAIDQGILTVDGGSISIFAKSDVSVGTSRIFTLHGGNEIIWSTLGNIDAGASSKTVQSAPPTRVIIDTQSGNVETDLAGLATGGGIGVLETVAGAAPGNVDLVAPVGTVNAGDAGIRSSGNINIAAAHVVNAGNIQAGGASTGVSTTSTPNIGATVAAAAAGGASQNAASAAAAQQQQEQSQNQSQNLPSIISVEIIGYGGGDTDNASTTPTSPPETGPMIGAE